MLAWNHPELFLCTKLFIRGRKVNEIGNNLWQRWVFFYNILLQNQLGKDFVFKVAHILVIDKSLSLIHHLISAQMETFARK